MDWWAGAASVPPLVTALAYPSPEITPPAEFLRTAASQKGGADADTDGRQGGERIRRASFPDASFQSECQQARNLLQAVSSACTTALALTAPVREPEAYAERETAPRY